MKLPNLSGYAIRCWGYRGSLISHPKLANPTSSCIHPSTHNQETFGNHLPQPSKSIRYTSYGNTPELPPQYWVASRLSHQQLHKRDFRCRQNSGISELQRKNYDDNTSELNSPGHCHIKDRRHQEQCSHPKTIGTIPRYPRDHKFFSEI